MMRWLNFSLFLRLGLALVLLAAGLAVMVGFDRMGHRFHVLGAAEWMRLAAGAEQVAAAILLMVPGRAGYGAALGLIAGGAATMAHAATLGWDSAPPAMAICALSALLLWRNRADLRR
ncbi:DoxX family protein [bacterium]|nr:DoxX family protein [bacterium]